MRGLDSTLCRPPEGINNPSSTGKVAADKAVADSDDPTAVAGFVDKGSGCKVLPTLSAEINGRLPNARATTGDGSGNDAAKFMPPLATSSIVACAATSQEHQQGLIALLDALLKTVILGALLNSMR